MRRAIISPFIAFVLIMLITTAGAEYMGANINQQENRQAGIGPCYFMHLGCWCGESKCVGLTRTTQSTTMTSEKTPRTSTTSTTQASMTSTTNSYGTSTAAASSTTSTTSMTSTITSFSSSSTSTTTSYAYVIVGTISFFIYNATACAQAIGSSPCRYTAYWYVDTYAGWGEDLQLATNQTETLGFPTCSTEMVWYFNTNAPTTAALLEFEIKTSNGALLLQQWGVYNSSVFTQTLAGHWYPPC